MTLLSIKRTHRSWQREFPWGVPRPYAWPRPTLLGGVDQARLPEQMDDVRDVSEIRVEFDLTDARVQALLADARFEWIKQSLSTLLARTAGATAAPETTDTAAAGRPFAVIQSKRERIAAVLREEYPPHGIPRWGQGWEKGAEEKLKERGIDTCRAEYFHAVAINKRLANSLSPETI